MTTWDIMDGLAERCRKHIEGIERGRIPNGDPIALRHFQDDVARQLSPLMLLVMVEAWQKLNPRPERKE